MIEGAAGLLRQLTTFCRARRGRCRPKSRSIVTSPNLFDLLGVQPVLGRGFATEEGGPKRPPVIVLTHELWQRIGADRTILGTTYG